MVSTIRSQGPVYKPNTQFHDRWPSFSLLFVFRQTIIRNLSFSGYQLSEFRHAAFISLAHGTLASCSPCLPQMGICRRGQHESRMDVLLAIYALTISIASHIFHAQTVSASAILFQVCFASRSGVSIPHLLAMRICNRDNYSSCKPLNITIFRIKLGRARN